MDLNQVLIASGLSEEDAATYGRAMDQAAADLADLAGDSVEHVLHGFRAGVLGEAEPLRPLGVVISEDATRAKARELGLGELTMAVKATARCELILEQIGKLT